MRVCVCVRNVSGFVTSHTLVYQDRHVYACMYRIVHIIIHVSIISPPPSSAPSSCIGIGYAKFVYKLSMYYKHTLFRANVRRSPMGL